MQQILDWLKELDLEQYADPFCRNGLIRASSLILLIKISEKLASCSASAQDPARDSRTSWSGN